MAIGYRRSSETWGSEAECCRRMSLGRVAFRKLVRAGLIGTLSIQGLPDRFMLADVQRVMESNFRPARTRGAKELVEV